MIGINEVRRRAGLSSNETGPSLARAVYGHEHLLEEHPHQHLYHPLLLRQVVKCGDKKLTLAFPNGIPGGWSSTRKIHFICHSMGT